MNKKFILLPLTLSAMALVACGQNGGDQSSSGGLHTEPQSSQGVDSEGESTPSSEETAKDQLKDIQAGQEYTVVAKVVAKTAKGIVIHDGTGGAYCYDSNLASTYNVGDVIEVTGGVTEYHGVLQFAFNATPAVTAKAATATIEVPAATELTAALADGLTAIMDNPAEVKEYTWTSVAAKVDGRDVLKVPGSDTNLQVIDADAAVFAPVEGQAYVVRAYYSGYCTKYSYGNIYLTSLTETVVEPTSVTVAAEETSVRVGETLALTATVLPATANQTVTWSVKAGSEAYASVSDAGVVTGLAEGEATIVASSVKEGVAGEITLTVNPAAATPVASLTLNATEKALVVSDTFQLEASVLPAEANQSVSYESSNAEVATVSATGLVTAVAAGSANITVTTLGLDGEGVAKTATLAVTVTTLPAATPITIAELNAKTENDTTHLYTVSGILDWKKANDAYGNGWLVDPETGDNIMLYGLTATESAITYSNGAVGFTNPKDALTTIADVAAGEYITMTAVFKVYNGTPEIMGVLESHEAVTEKMDVTVSVTEGIENGSVTLDKETGKWGDTITVTPTPAAGYQVKSVKVVHNGWTEAVTANEGVYSFSASQKNVVSAEFEAIPEGNVKTLDLDLTNTANPHNIPTTASKDGSENVSFTAGNVTFGGINCNMSSYNGASYLMMYAKNTTDGTVPAIYNKTAFPGKILSIEFHTRDGSAVAAVYNLSLGTEAMATAGLTSDLKVTGKNQTLTYTAAPTDAYTYFNISVDAGNNGQLDKLVITYEAE